MGKTFWIYQRFKSNINWSHWFDNPFRGFPPFPSFFTRSYYSVLIPVIAPESCFGMWYLLWEMVYSYLVQTLWKAVQRIGTLLFGVIYHLCQRSCPIIELLEYQQAYHVMQRQNICVRKRPVNKNALHVASKDQFS